MVSPVHQPISGEKNKNKGKTKLMGLNQLEMRHPQKHQKWVRASGIPTCVCEHPSTDKGLTAG